MKNFKQKPIPYQYAAMNAGIVPPLQPRNQAKATLWYRNIPILQNVAWGLAVSRKQGLLATGSYRKEFLKIKPHL